VLSERKRLELAVRLSKAVTNAGYVPIPHAGRAQEQTDGKMRGSLGNESFGLGVHEYANYACRSAKVDRERRVTA
jgi:hypothetical protein